ncbi:MAG: methylenetetrahydrofolate reductase [Sphingomonadaceae bacterium]|nr:methylenetetrahydrofolate reductase [Sphingomonadaceae bacterium]
MVELDDVAIAEIPRGQVIAFDRYRHPLVLDKAPEAVDAEIFKQLEGIFSVSPGCTPCTPVLTSARRRTRCGAMRVFLVAGDPPQPEGPFSDTLQMTRTGIFEDNGITAIGIAGHPEGHPAVSAPQLWDWMERKIEEITGRGMAPLVVTQFGFDSDAFLSWLAEMRQRDIDAPVHIGMPGPGGIKRLLRYAKFCGVGASASVLKNYGISLTNLIGPAGPDKLVDALRTGMGPEHGRVRLHFYPFGGLKPTVEWINQHAAKHGDALPRYDMT